MKTEPHVHDVAVIGAGLAGLAAALALEPRLNVGLYCKGAGSGGASSWAQGGLAAVVTAQDSIDEHVDDTLTAGRGLCDEAAVTAIVSQGPAAVAWLEELGVPFSRTASGELQLSREGGHGHRRIVHASDATGAAILGTLAPTVEQRANVTLMPQQLAVDLVVEDGRVAGFYSLDRSSGRVTTVRAKAIVLATGGAGKVYRYTTNPDDSTGDGIAMAWRAGCPIANMEFVQFHPTALFHPQAKAVLVSEAARGEGAVLVNRFGERFMQSCHPDAELAPRDIVARAIDTEMKRSGADCVYLDFAPVGDATRIRERFPSISQRCAQLGIDITAELVPVVPSAHYLCGGIVAGIDGTTTINGLHAVGETACTGLHGANRLASNSLLECIVGARGAAARINAELPATLANIPPWDDSRVGPAHEEVMVAHNWDEIRRMMWNYVGIVRSNERLTRAAHRLKLITEEVDQHYRNYVVSSDFLELRNLLVCAHLIIKSAQARKESRGLHYNLDCPQPDCAALPTVLQHDRRNAKHIVTTILHAN